VNFGVVKGSTIPESAENVSHPQLFTFTNVYTAGISSVQIFTTDKSLEMLDEFRVEINRLEHTSVIVFIIVELSTTYTLL